jgi:hypothetical protein
VDCLNRSGELESAMGWPHSAGWKAACSSRPRIDGDLGTHHDRAWLRDWTSPALDDRFLSRREEARWVEYAAVAEDTVGSWRSGAKEGRRR